MDSLSVLGTVLEKDEVKKVLKEEDLKQISEAMETLKKLLTDEEDEIDTCKTELAYNTENLPENFGQPIGTEYKHAVGDLVWVLLQGYPTWPAELLSVDSEAVKTLKHSSPKTKKNKIPCKLFCGPPEHDGTVYWASTRNVQYFDRLPTQTDFDECIKYRLMADRYDVSAYEDRFRESVHMANSCSRTVLTPEAMPGYTVTPVGAAYTNFRAHYQAPRQPSANDQVKKETGVIVLRDGLENLVRDLNKFDRIWVVFQFSFSGETNRTKKKDGKDFFNGWKAMIVPPRDTKLRGLFATRSPHRPNSIGLSCCRLLDVSGRVLTIRDHDLLHGTPILDIKPYLPFCDSHPDSNHGWVDDLDTPGPDHRWNEKQYTVHRQAKGHSDPVVDKPSPK